MFKRSPKSKKEKIKVVKIATEEREHECTEKCFKTKRKSKHGNQVDDASLAVQMLETRKNVVWAF